MRMHELETTFSAASLDYQMDRIVNCSLQIYHGPDRMKYFDDFSVDHVISEVRQHAPDILQLLALLGQAPSLWL